MFSSPSCSLSLPAPPVLTSVKSVKSVTSVKSMKSVTCVKSVKSVTSVKSVKSVTSGGSLRIGGYQIQVDSGQKDQRPPVVNRSAWGRWVDPWATSSRRTRHRGMRGESPGHRQGCAHARARRHGHGRTRKNVLRQVAHGACGPPMHLARAATPAITHVRHAQTTRSGR
jgi:hypothetical protein